MVHGLANNGFAIHFSPTAEILDAEDGCANSGTRLRDADFEKLDPKRYNGNTSTFSTLARAWHFGTFGHQWTLRLLDSLNSWGCVALDHMLGARSLGYLEHSRSS